MFAVAAGTDKPIAVMLVAKTPKGHPIEKRNAAIAKLKKESALIKRLKTDGAGHKIHPS